MGQKTTKKQTSKRAEPRTPPKRKLPGVRTTEGTQGPQTEPKAPPPVRPRRRPRVTGGRIPPLGSKEESPLWRWRKKTMVLAAKTPQALQKAIDTAQAAASNGDVAVRCVYSPGRGVPWFTLSYMERIS